MRKRNESQQLIEKIEELTAGQSVVYYKGMTGWMFGSMTSYGDFISWLERAYKLGKWDFTQRKVSHVGETGVYEYIATRRRHAQPLFWIVEE